MNFSRQRFSGIHKRLSGAQVDSPDKHPGLDRRPCCSVAWLGVAWRQFRCGHSVLHSAIRYLRFINAPEVTTLRHYTNRFIIIIIIIIILSPPAQSRRHRTRLHIQNMVATEIFSVTMVLWKKTAFPLCRAMERRWKKNIVSRVSSVIVVIRLQISCVSSISSCRLVSYLTHVGL